MLRFKEELLVSKDNCPQFYSTIHAELHDKTDVTVYSDEPLGSNYSCFDYSYEGDDREKDDPEHDIRHIWKNCKLIMDDDGLYWESASGKNAALSIYAIVKMELMPRHIKIWVAPKDSSDQMAVVDFYC